MSGVLDPPSQCSVCYSKMSECKICNQLTCEECTVPCSECGSRVCVDCADFLGFNRWICVPCK